MDDFPLLLFFWKKLNCVRAASFSILLDTFFYLFSNSYNTTIFTMSFPNDEEKATETECGEQGLSEATELVEQLIDDLEQYQNLSERLLTLNDSNIADINASQDRVLELETNFAKLSSDYDIQLNLASNNKAEADEYANDLMAAYCKNEKKQKMIDRLTGRNGSLFGLIKSGCTDSFTYVKLLFTCIISVFTLSYSLPMSIVRCLLYSVYMAYLALVFPVRMTIQMIHDLCQMINMIVGKNGLLGKIESGFKKVLNKCGACYNYVAESRLGQLMLEFTNTVCLLLLIILIAYVCLNAEQCVKFFTDGVPVKIQEGYDYAYNYFGDIDTYVCPTKQTCSYISTIATEATCYWKALLSQAATAISPKDALKITKPKYANLYQLGAALGQPLKQPITYAFRF